jgi:hypothetical protein
MGFYCPFLPMKTRLWAVLSSDRESDQPIGILMAGIRGKLPKPDPEFPLHGCYVSVTIQKCTEVPHAAKCGRHFHLSFKDKMYRRVPPTFCRVRYSGSGYCRS